MFNYKITVIYSVFTLTMITHANLENIVFKNKQEALQTINARFDTIFDFPGNNIFYSRLTQADFDNWGYLMKSVNEYVGRTSDNAITEANITLQNASKIIMNTLKSTYSQCLAAQKQTQADITCANKAVAPLSPGLFNQLKQVETNGPLLKIKGQLLASSSKKDAVNVLIMMSKTLQKIITKIRQDLQWFGARPTISK